MTMYEKKFKDSDTWETITEEELREYLDGYYAYVDLVIDEVLKKGNPVQTNWSIFRVKES